jgi:prepilin-type N-terminal cleavage/methylation domain-containing protein
MHAGFHMRRLGFTLIELLIVVAIIGLVATIAIPKLANLKGRAQVSAMKSDLRNLVTIEENYFAQNMKYTADPGSAYSVSVGNALPTITLTSDGWTAVMTSPTAGQTCTVFVGSTRATPATTEGSPACAKSGSATVTP